MFQFLVSWKTTVAGVATLLIALGQALHAISQGLAPSGVDVATIIGGIGLIFAKDKNVTGGTKQQ